MGMDLTTLLLDSNSVFVQIGIIFYLSDIERIKVCPYDLTVPEVYNVMVWKNKD